MPHSLGEPRLTRHIPLPRFQIPILGLSPTGRPEAPTAPHRPWSVRNMPNIRPAVYGPKSTTRRCSVYTKPSSVKDIPRSTRFLTRANNSLPCDVPVRRCSTNLTPIDPTYRNSAKSSSTICTNRGSMIAISFTPRVKRPSSLSSRNILPDILPDIGSAYSESS